MPVANRGSGLRAAIPALGSQVKPLFMAPALASSVYGGLLAGGGSILPAAVHLAATFLAVYTAHVKDGYVDFYERGEDEDLPLTRAGCRLAIAGAGVGFVACLVLLWWLAGPGAALLTVPLWPLGYLHAPWLDRHPVGTSFDYAVGVALVVVGAFYAQVGHLSPLVLGIAGVFVPVLAAGAILSDVDDIDADRRIGKRTVSVVLGVRGAGLVAAGLVGLSAVLVVGLVIVGLLPTAGLAAAAVLALAGAGSRAGSAAGNARRGLLLLMAGMATAATLLLLSTRGIPPW